MSRETIRIGSVGSTAEFYSGSIGAFFHQGREIENSPALVGPLRYRIGARHGVTNRAEKFPPQAFLGELVGQSHPKCARGFQIALPAGALGKYR